MNNIDSSQKKHDRYGHTNANKHSSFSSATTFLSILLFLASICIYANTLKNNYAFDDVMVIQDNSLVKKGLKAIPMLLMTPRMLGNQTSSNDAYRPLSVVMFAIEYQFFGLNPTAGHLLNILFYSCCVVLLFISLLKLFGQETVSTMFIASLLFALHPIHTEVVANIKSRDEIMCFFFSFLALFTLLKYIDNKQVFYLLTGSIFFFFSLLSKETSFTFIAIIPLALYIYHKGDKKQNLIIIISTIISAIIFLIIRHIVLNRYNANHLSEISYIDNMLVNPPSPESALATKIFILGKYLMLLFIPYPLVCDYSYNSILFSSFKDWTVITSVTAYILLACISWYWINKKSTKIIAFAILFYLITLSLFSNIPFLIGSQMAERFLFFPSVGFCLAAAFAITKIAPLANITNLHTWIHPRLLTIVIPIIGFYILIDVKRNKDWVDNYHLFSADVVKVPENSRMNNYLAIELNNMSDSEQHNIMRRERLLLAAKRYSLKAVEVSTYPQNVDAIYSLANSYKKLQMYDSAQYYLLRALIVDSNHIHSLNALGAVYGITRNYDKAIALFEKAISIDPTNVNAYLNIAGSYMMIKDYQLAIKYFSMAYAINPENKTALSYLAKARQMQGSADSAKKYNTMAP